MKKLWMGTLAMLILAFAPFQATAQEAASSLNGIWLNATAPEGQLAFLTIIHKADGQMAVISTNYVNILGIVEGYQSAASLGQVDPAALGENVGTAMSFPALFQNADLRFNVHRPSENELIVELTSCEVPEGNVVSCDQVYDNFPLNEGVHHMRAF